MAEAEDVLTDIARHATVYAQQLWQKYRQPQHEPHKIILRDIAERLDLLILSAFRKNYPIRVAQPPAPPTLLSRGFRRVQHPWHSQALPATDGEAIWLPMDLAMVNLPNPQRFFRILALQQAMRAQRNSPAFLAQLSDPMLRDIFLLQEAQAADEALIQMFPGVKADIQALRWIVLESRPPISSFSNARQPLEKFYRQLLKENCRKHYITSTSVASPEDSIREAKRIAPTLMTASHQYSVRVYSVAPLLKDWWTGELRLHSSPILSKFLQNANSIEPEKLSRSARLPRRPDVREPTEDENKTDRKDDAWMVQGDESHPKAEDPMGLQRPVDRDAEISADEFADLVSELAQARLVSTPDQSKEVLLSDETPDKRSQTIQAAQNKTIAELIYPEWDYQKQAYRIPGANVCLKTPAAGSQQWVDKTLTQHRSLINVIQRHFELLRARPVLQRKQYDGEDIDLDAYVTSYSNFQAGNSLDEALYQTHRISDRNTAVSLLIDISGSTDSWIANQRRVIDVEREALLLVSIALQSLDLPWSILAFSGTGPQAVSVREIKNFRESFNNEVALRISALEPERFTRVGTALRHSTAQLMGVSTAHRLLILLSDGKPNDNDNYEGRYGVEDTRQAVIEARNQGIHPFCLTIDRQAANYMPSMFGPGQYALLPHPEKLPSVLLEWMKRLLTC